jgi:oxalate decarboxylase/phosphoglucose isomerase-like protein (cupin superfamily)
MALYYSNWNVGGELVKQDERYKVFDNNNLNNLILSKTVLNPYKSTTGHRHKGQEEVYIFSKGNGIMEIEKEGKQKTQSVTIGSIILIEDDDFHRVHNKSGYPLEFICIFDGKRTH